MYDILVYKQNKYIVKIHSISASSFWVVMKKQKVSLLYSVYHTEFIIEILIKPQH